VDHGSTKKIKNAGCSHYIIENKDQEIDTMSYTQYIPENKRPIDFANIFLKIH